MKTRKAFGKLDIILYATLVLLIALLFLFFVILPKNDGDGGFEIYLDGEKVFTLYYLDGSYEILSDNVEISRNGDTVTVTVNSEKGFNVITANLTDKTVKVTDADCSISKTCVYSPAISGNGVIICVPHGLRVEPLGYDVTVG